MLPAQDAPPPDAGSASQGLGTPVVEIADLEFRYGTQDTPLLRLERLEVAAAERLLIVGPSGCGKSTLMSLLAGVLVANRGRVAILGTDWRALSPSARDRRRGDHVGYLFQQFNLLDWLPVLDNVCLPCRFSARRASRATIRSGSIERDAGHWLEALGFGRARWRQPAGTLSVGEQQRVAAARALNGTPELLLADEPTSALDDARRDEFMSLLLSACERAQSALVLVSHDRELERHFDRGLALGADR
ncbi:MAG: ABC transporter ATP-binding protein [Betaproteobacteria bacterium]